MKQPALSRLTELCDRYPVLFSVRNSIVNATQLIIDCFNIRGKLLICGNGGSAADALHIVGELMKSFVIYRELSDSEKARFEQVPDRELLTKNLHRALPAISLINESSLSTAYANDAIPELAFAQQLYGLGNVGDVLFAISTSGNSKNIIYAAETARAVGIKVIGLTGNTGGKLKQFCDACIRVPESETFKIQELHLPVYHAMCLAVEEEFFGR
jgi:D-sedoheptulose 7-phosphate isomerase